MLHNGPVAADREGFVDFGGAMRALEETLADLEQALAQLGSPVADPAEAQSDEPPSAGPPEVV